MEPWRPGGALTVLRHAYPDGVDGRVGFAPDLQRHLPRLAAAHDGLVEAAAERHAEHVVRGHLRRRRVVEQGQPFALHACQQFRSSDFSVQLQQKQQQRSHRK